MEGLKRQIKFQVMDSKKAFIIFWGIVLAVNILFYYLNGTAPDNVSYGTSYNITTELTGESINTHYINVAGSNVIAIGVFIIVCCMVMYYETFPTAIGFSSTRRDYYLGVLASNVILCFAMAVIEGVLLKLDKYIVRAVGRQPLNEFLMLNLEQDSIIYVIAVLFVMLILCCAVFNLLGTVLYKFGYKVWFVFLAIAFIQGNFFPKNYFSGIGKFFAFNNFITFSAKLIFISIVMYGVGWLLIRRQNIRSGN